MKRDPILVFADDLTGAAEIAALGHQRGLRTSILLDATSELPTDADLIVIDSNSRQDPPELAASKLRALATLLPDSLRRHVFKKVDSVLRGPVAAELEALATALHRKAVLLCPCNPSRGRCIVRGRYLIDGVPLDKTPFVADPHYPARSDEVTLLLDCTSLPLHAHDAEQAPQAPLSTPGIHIGSAASTSDVQAWAGRINTSLLAAGGADFFDAYLTHLGLPPATTPAGCHVTAPHLLLSGSLAPAGIAFRSALSNTNTSVIELPVQTRDLGELERCIDRLLLSLSRDGRAVAATSDHTLTGFETEAWLQTCFCLTAAKCQARHGFTHLLAEGGATAVLAAAALAWRSFTVAGVWAGGVVSLRPDAAPSQLFTIKPGSYHWPAEIRALLAD